MEWMIVLPFGSAGPNEVLVRLEPIASTRSARAMNSQYIFGLRARGRAERQADGVSAIALLPGLVQATGAGISSASAASFSPASA